jgi:lipopolysaccharide transport system ATP-binding protein
MSSSDISIQVKDLGKSYNIYKHPQDRLKQSVIPRLQQLVGRSPHRYFREFWALRNVTFDVQKGETIGIIGRNGSGKSTLLQLICGTLSATTGTVMAQGRIAALLELGSGFNPQFTGRENVYLNGAILGLSRNEIDVRFDDIAGFADIGEFIEQPVKMYSSGMVVRLAFAVQAMIDPDILVVDEALAVGDEKFQRKCFARIEELKFKGTSILFVSHSGPQIIELCDRALLLEKGEQIFVDQPLRVVRAYQKLIFAPASQQAALIQEYRTGAGVALDKTFEETPPDQNYIHPDEDHARGQDRQDRSD